MPVYEYQCRDCKNTEEKLHRMDEKPEFECERCGADLKRKISAVPVHYKGSGFYCTDYPKKDDGNS